MRSWSLTGRVCEHAVGSIDSPSSSAGIKPRAHTSGLFLCADSSPREQVRRPRRLNAARSSGWAGATAPPGSIFLSMTSRPPVSVSFLVSPFSGVVADALNLRIERGDTAQAGGGLPRIPHHRGVAQGGHRAYRPSILVRVQALRILTLSANAGGA